MIVLDIKRTCCISLMRYQWLLTQWHTRFANFESGMLLFTHNQSQHGCTVIQGHALGCGICVNEVATNLQSSCSQEHLNCWQYMLYLCCIYHTALSLWNCTFSAYSCLHCHFEKLLPVCCCGWGCFQPSSQQVSVGPTDRQATWKHRDPAKQT